MDALLPFSQAQSKVKLGRTMIYKLMAEGDLERIKIGTRTFITESSLNSYIERTIADQRSSRASTPNAGTNETNNPDADQIAVVEPSFVEVL